MQVFSYTLLMHWTLVCRAFFPPHWSINCGHFILKFLFYLLLFFISGILNTFNDFIIFLWYQFNVISIQSLWQTHLVIAKWTQTSDNIPVLFHQEPEASQLMHAFHWTSLPGGRGWHSYISVGGPSGPSGFVARSSAFIYSCQEGAVLCVVL